MRYRLVIVLSLVFVVANVHALIMVHKGNDPVTDREWPAGALEVANLKSRGGYWEGPPFGGGRWVFEYQGDVKALQEALDAFAKVKWPELRLVVHDGENGSSFIYREDKAKGGAGADWTFTVWTPRNFHNLYSREGGASLISASDPSGNLGKAVEPPTIDVFLTGRIDFKHVNIPKNLKVIDERATAAGYAPADGSVCRGQVYDMVDSKPVADAEVKLGNNDRTVSAKTDADGKFELKNVPPGNYQLTILSPDHAGRTVGYAQFAKDTLKAYTVMLAPPARVAGVVKDQDGKPVAGVKVRADATVAVDGFGYILAGGKAEATTDAAGKFELTGLPAGTLRFFPHAKGYFPLDSLRQHKAPADDIELRVTATGTIKGRILDAAGQPDPKAQVSIYPEGGSKVGTWGASGNLNEKAEFSFDAVPPGRYVVSPDVGRQHTKQPETNAKTVEVKAGQVAEVELTKK